MGQTQVFCQMKTPLPGVLDGSRGMGRRPVVATLAGAAGRWLLLEQLVVDHGVVGPVHEQRLAVDPEPRALGHVGLQDLDVVAAVHLDRGPVLGPDHDRLGRAAPQLLEAVADVVDPGRAGLVVVEPELRGDLLGDVDEPVLRQDHGRPDVVDVRVGQRDEQHRRVAVALAVAVRGVELRVTADAEAGTLDLVDRLAVLVVRGHRGAEAAERLLELVGGGTEQSAAGEAEDESEDDDDSADDATDAPLFLLTSHYCTSIGERVGPGDIILFLVIYVNTYVRMFLYKNTPWVRGGVLQFFVSIICRQNRLRRRGRNCRLRRTLLGR